VAAARTAADDLKRTLSASSGAGAVDARFRAGGYQRDEPSPNSPAAKLAQKTTTAGTSAALGSSASASGGSSDRYARQPAARSSATDPHSAHVTRASLLAPVGRRALAAIAGFEFTSEPGEARREQPVNRRVTLGCARCAAGAWRASVLLSRSRLFLGCRPAEVTENTAHFPVRNRQGCASRPASHGLACPSC
jgi:hypothetical protein